jgi:UDP-glucose:(heptosyl)LPS alpha-1,3-glucosyltransferase
MNIAFCYQSVLPARGGCETYIADLARRLVSDRHEVHLYACRWDEAALPEAMHYHRLSVPACPRFLRPWLFASACARALRTAPHQVSVGFDKTWGQDVLYPQGGLHAASMEYNLMKFPSPVVRSLARFGKWISPAYWSFSRLERRQYLGRAGNLQPLVVVNSVMVRGHFQRYYGIGPEDLFVVPSAIDPQRFEDFDRPRQRLEFRQQWGIAPEETVALFVAMNYRLKGLEPLLHAVSRMPAVRSRQKGFRLVVAGSLDTTWYQRLARRLGIAESVRFIGPCHPMRTCYFGADFLVHPTFYDPCSLVVLEALACALPIVTSRYNGASELLTPPREGYVVKNPHDHEHLAWCMTQLLDPARRTACSHAARKTAAQWTFDHHYRQLLQVFQEAAARKRAA